MWPFNKSRPRVGTEVVYLGKNVGKVVRVEGNLCWVESYRDAPFIWRFRDGLNNMHDWPGKNKAHESPAARQVA